ncbi:hypothetical protein BHM03_00016492 [Ensete ventricosum]|nr:hypothetical protein BHM03_00016492 [Ensete ventricosum]
MEQITEGVNNLSVAADSFKKNRIQVSNTKKPLFFYVNLAKVADAPPFFDRFRTLTLILSLPSLGFLGFLRYMQQYDEAELSALGMDYWLLFEFLSKIIVIEILLGKTENFDELMAAAAQRGDGDGGEEQS